MLLRFGVSNHRSILHYQELLLTASKLKDGEQGLLKIGSSAGSHEATAASSVLAVYGSNASGKSTVLQALSFFVGTIEASHTGGAERKGTPYFPYSLDEKSSKLPSQYDADIVIDDTRYHFGFTLDGNSILSEWMYSYPFDGSRKVRTVLYHRDSSLAPEDQFHFGKSLRGENKVISKLVRPNSLYLSTAAQNAHPQLSKVFEYFANKITARLDLTEEPVFLANKLEEYFSENESRRTQALSFLKAADIGITEISFKKEPVKQLSKEFLSDFNALLGKHFPAGSPEIPFDDERVRAFLMHKGEGGASFGIKLEAESKGTVSLLSLLGPIFDHLTNGGVLILDELNSTLHPLVTRELIKLFTNHLSNPGNAQLVFSTHDTNLLSGGLLRRDQIWFAEKDDYGCSHFYSMAEMKIRGTDNFEKGYLTGRFGSVPFVNGNFDFLSLK